MAGSRPPYIDMYIAPTYGQEQDQHKAWEYGFELIPGDTESEWVLIPQDVDKVIVFCSVLGKFGQYDVEKTNSSVYDVKNTLGEGIVWEHPRITTVGFYDTKPCTAIRLIQVVAPATDCKFLIRAI